MVRCGRECKGLVKAFIREIIDSLSVKALDIGGLRHVFYVRFQGNLNNQEQCARSWGEVTHTPLVEAALCITPGADLALSECYPGAMEYRMAELHAQTLLIIDN